MPWGDGTGPQGLGPRTGRGLGYCNGYAEPGFMKGPGMGMGWGRGYGRGLGRGYGAGRGWGRGYGFYGRRWGPPVVPVVPAVPVSEPVGYAPSQDKESIKRSLELQKTRLEEAIKYIDEQIKRYSEEKEE